MMGIAAALLLGQALPPRIADGRIPLHFTGTTQPARYFALDDSRAECRAANKEDARTALDAIRRAVGSGEPYTSDWLRVSRSAPNAPAFRISFHVPAKFTVDLGGAVSETPDTGLRRLNAFAGCAFVTVVHERDAGNTLPGVARSGFYFVPDRGLIFFDNPGMPSVIKPV
jgi:hypothetical protein